MITYSKIIFNLQIHTSLYNIIIILNTWITKNKVIWTLAMIKELD